MPNPEIITDSELRKDINKRISDKLFKIKSHVIEFKESREYIEQVPQKINNVNDCRNIMNTMNQVTLSLKFSCNMMERRTQAFVKSVHMTKIDPKAIFLPEIRAFSAESTKYFKLVISALDHDMTQIASKKDKWLLK